MINNNETNQCIQLNTTTFLPGPRDPNTDPNTDRHTLYDKIIHLRDSIAAGLHPTLSLSGFPSAPLAKSSIVSSSQPCQDGPTEPSAKKYLAESLAGQTNASSKQTRDKYKTKRTEIERTLRISGAQQAKKARRQYDMRATLYHEQQLDVVDILRKAQLLIPPVSGLPIRKKDRSQSFDENDYYSSQDNVSSLISKDDAVADDADSDAMNISEEGEISDDDVEPPRRPRAQAKPAVAAEVPPQLQPETKPEPKIQLHPKSQPRLEPELQPELQPKPQLKPQPKPQLKPQSKSQPKPQSTPQSKSQSKPRSKPQSTPQPKPQSTPQSRPQLPGLQEFTIDSSPYLPRSSGTLVQTLSAEDNDYEPPAADSPQYEPSSLLTVAQPLAAEPQDEAQPPHAISLNHIDVPSAPQPAHISSHAAANLSQQLEQSSEPLTMSDLETTKLSKSALRKSRKAHRREKREKANLAKTVSTNAQSNTLKSKKKRKKELEEMAKSNKRRREVITASAPAPVKQEILTPPIMAAPRGPRSQQNGHDTPGQTSVPSFQVPVGYKLVRIEDDDEPRSHAEASSAAQHMPPPMPYSRRTALRDHYGNEYYPQAKPYRQDYSARPLMHEEDTRYMRVPAASYDYLSQEVHGRNPYTMDPLPRRQHGPYSPQYRPAHEDVPYYIQPRLYRSIVPPYDHVNHTAQEPVKRHGGALPSEGRPYSPPPPRRVISEHASHLMSLPHAARQHRPDIQHGLPPVSDSHHLPRPRAQSVVPPPYPDPYRHGVVAPSLRPDSYAATRATSVFSAHQDSAHVGQYLPVPRYLMDDRHMSAQPPRY